MTAVRVGGRGGALAVAALPVAIGCGFALAWLGGRFEDAGPLVMVLLAVVPLLALGVVGQPLIGIFVVLGVFPRGFTPLPGLPLDLVQGTAVAVAVLILLRRVAARDEGALWAPALWWGVALFAWTLVGTPSAADPDLASRRLLISVSQFLLAVAVVAAARSRRDVRIIAGALVAVAAAVGATTLGSAQQVDSAFGGAVVSGRATGIFSEPNQLGSFTGVAALAGIGLALGLRSRRHRIAAGTFAALALVTLLLSLSRGAWIGFGVGMLVLVVSVPHARRVLGIGTLVLFVVALGYGALRPQSPEVHVIGERFRSFAGEKNPYDSRPAIWAEARREIILDPFTGHGLGNFPLVAQRSTSKSHTAFPPHAHNLLLNWAAETGLPGVACILGLAAHLGVVVRRALRRMRAEGRARDAAVLAGLGGAALAVLGQGFVDYTLWSSVVLAELWVVIGAIAAMLELERR
ncbi:MAG TPA: O-antigen ligase family protein [Acidimicrobiales bacterium]